MFWTVSSEPRPSLMKLEAPAGKLDGGHVVDEERLRGEADPAREAEERRGHESAEGWEEEWVDGDDDLGRNEEGRAEEERLEEEVVAEAVNEDALRGEEATESKGEAVVGTEGAELVEPAAEVAGAALEPAAEGSGEAAERSVETTGTAVEGSAETRATAPERHSPAGAEGRR